MYVRHFTRNFWNILITFNLPWLSGWDTPHLMSMPFSITGWDVVWTWNHALFPHLLVYLDVGELLSLPTSLVPATCYSHWGIELEPHSLPPPAGEPLSLPTSLVPFAPQPLSDRDMGFVLPHSRPKISHANRLLQLAEEVATHTCICSDAYTYIHTE